MAHYKPDDTVRDALRLAALGLTDREIASVHGISVSTVWRWRHGQPGGRSAQPHCAVPCPRCEDVDLDEFAFVHLLGWYLGDGYIIEGRRGVYALSIFNDAKYGTLNDEIALPHQRWTVTAETPSSARQATLAPLSAAARPNRLARGDAEIRTVSPSTMLATLETCDLVVCRPCGEPTRRFPRRRQSPHEPAL